MPEGFASLGMSILYVLLGITILLIAKILKNVMTPYSIGEELTEKDNPALGLSLTGYYAAVMIVFLGASVGDDLQLDRAPMSEILKVIGTDALFALWGIAALLLGSFILDKAILYKFATRKEIIEDRNVGTGAVEFGGYIATGLIIAGALGGEGGGWLTAHVFFVLGQIVLVLFGLFYQRITRYDIHDEIEKDNVAAGVSLGGNLIAVGVVLFRATGVDFIGWKTNLIEFSALAVVGFVLMLLMHKTCDHVFLPNTSLAHEIAHDRNVSAAWIESVICIGSATIIYFML
jgi:uncharacterized membrane protein YjfL (UPF0719 family)